MPASLYTGKVRAYLRKQRIAFEERPAGDPRFRDEVLPKVGRWIIPVVQLPDGTLLQDGAVIIDHFEASGMGQGPRALPADPLLAVLAHLFELFGGEGLLRPAMHYRWNFDTDNLDFLRADFASALSPGATEAEQEATFTLASKRMRSAGMAFGVSSATAATVEASAVDFLQRLDRHFAATPYVLGQAPTYADYGLIAPLYAHLGRDPHPAALMKRVAPRVWRWVERMNAPDDDAGEYLGRAPEWLDPAAPGDTLEALLGFMAEDYLPELEAHVAFADAWLAKRPELVAGSNGMPKPGERAIGIAPVVWRGHPIHVVVMPYRLYMLQRVQDAAARLDSAQAALLQALLARNGLGSVLGLRCRRRVLRQGHFEVWGPDATAAPSPAA
jgi:glutathione S-transferase